MPTKSQTKTPNKEKNVKRIQELLQEAIRRLKTGDLAFKEQTKLHSDIQNYGSGECTYTDYFLNSDGELVWKSEHYVDYTPPTVKSGSMKYHMENERDNPGIIKGLEKVLGIQELN